MTKKSKAARVGRIHYRVLQTSHRTLCGMPISCLIRRDDGIGKPEWVARDRLVFHNWRGYETCTKRRAPSTHGRAFLPINPSKARQNNSLAGPPTGSPGA